MIRRVAKAGERLDKSTSGTTWPVAFSGDIDTTNSNIAIIGHRLDNCCGNRLMHPLPRRELEHAHAVVRVPWSRASVIW